MRKTGLCGLLWMFTVGKLRTRRERSGLAREPGRSRHEKGSVSSEAPGDTITQSRANGDARLAFSMQTWQNRGDSPGGQMEFGTHGPVHFFVSYSCFFKKELQEVGGLRVVCLLCPMGVSSGLTKSSL